MTEKEWTENDFNQAKGMKETMPDVVDALKRGPGRPKADSPKSQVTLRLDPAIIQYFKEGGKGWQSRINAVLKEYVSDRH